MTVATFGVTGMTCTSCSGRVERKLNKVDGVEATVNFATETANVSFDHDSVDPAAIIQIIRDTGYDAFELQPIDHSTATETSSPEAARDEHAQQLRTRLILSAILALPVFLLSMFHQLQFDNWQWLSFALTSPVFFWGGWPFHKAAWANLKHGVFTMDTLISLGTGAAYFWSVWALFWGNAGAK